MNHQDKPKKKNIDFATQFSRLCNRTRLPRQKLAEKLGISVQTLNHWENEESCPTARHLWDALRVFAQTGALRGEHALQEAQELWGLAEKQRERGQKPPLPGGFDEAHFQQFLEAAKASPTPLPERQETIPQRTVETKIVDEQQEKYMGLSSVTPAVQSEMLSHIIDADESEQGEQKELLPVDNADEHQIQVPDASPSTEEHMASQLHPPTPLPQNDPGRPSRRTVLVGLIGFVVGGLVGGGIGSYLTGHVHEHEAQWTLGGQVALGRSSFRAMLLMNGKVLIMGGYTADALYTSECELFDPIVNRWTRTQSSLHQGRSQHTATLLQNGKVLVIGGYAGGDESGFAELYDPLTAIWTQSKERMPLTRTRHTATLLLDGRVLVTGGVAVVPRSGQPLATAVLYDPTTDTWSPAGTMTLPRADHVAIRMLDGTVLVAGGTQLNDGVTKTKHVEVYNPQTREWQLVQSMEVSRAYFTAVLLQTGKVLVIGGRSDGFGPTATTELYDPVTRSWAMTAKMKYAREISPGQDAVVLNDGTVLVMGGDTTGTGEVYAPNTNTWMLPLKMSSSHCDGATTLLEDGKVMIVSGWDCSSSQSGTILTSAEIYIP